MATPDVAKLDLSTASASAHPLGLHSERRSNLAAGAETAKITVHLVLLAYAATLFAAAVLLLVLRHGLSAFAMLLAAGLAAAMGTLADVGVGKPPSKGEEAYTRWMIGIHVGMLLPAGVFVYFVASFSWATSPADWAVALALAAASSAAIFLIIALRPKSYTREAEGGALV